MDDPKAIIEFNSITIIKKSSHMLLFQKTNIFCRNIFDLTIWRFSMVNCGQKLDKGFGNFIFSKMIFMFI